MSNKPSSKDALKNRLSRLNEITITVTGRKSGRTISVPVWFVLEDGKLYLLPVSGSDTQWYKNVLKNPSIRIDAGGDTAELRAVPVTDPKQDSRKIPRQVRCQRRKEVLFEIRRRRPRRPALSITVRASLLSLGGRTFRSDIKLAYLPIVIPSAAEGPAFLLARARSGANVAAGFSLALEFFRRWGLQSPRKRAQKIGFSP